MNKIIVLKIAIIISFLLLTPLNQHGVPLFVVFIFGIYQFFADLSSGKFLGEAFLLIPILGTLVVAMICKYYKQRYLLLFCMFVLFLFLGNALGFSFDKEYFHLGYLWFIVPLTIFISSSILLLYFNFKKPQEQIA